MSQLTIPNENIEDTYLLAESNPHTGRFVSLISIQPGTTTQSHFHTETKETIEVLRGKGFVCIDGQEKEIRAGMKTVIKPNQVHNFYTKPGAFQDALLLKRTYEGKGYHDYRVG